MITAVFSNIPFDKMGVVKDLRVVVVDVKVWSIVVHQ